MTIAAEGLRAAEERARIEVGQARQRLRAALVEAYEAGTSYTELGELLGVSRQRVQQLIAG